MLEGLKNYRSFPHDRKEELHPAYMPPPTASQPSTIRVRPRVAKPKPIIAMPEVAATVPIAAPAHGHTLYNPQQFGKKRGAEPGMKSSGWSTFWVSVLLLGMMGASGYFVWPYTHDVWGVVRTWYDQKFLHTPAPADAPIVSPAATLPDSHVPAAPAKKNVNPPLAIPPKIQQAPGAESAPAPKAKPNAGAAGAGVPTSDLSQTAPPTSAAQATSARSNDSQGTSSQPVTNSQSSGAGPAANLPVTVHERLETVKGRLDRWLTAAGLSDRVKVTVVGGGLLLQGKLRPAEHQALLTRLQTVPAWIHVTDDVTFGNVPPNQPNE
jgi:hypothetical protein